MKAVILGGGTVGVQIVKELLEERQDVVLIEKNTDTAHQLSSGLDCIVIDEDGSDAEVLKKACGQDTDFFIAVTGSDEVNIIACGVMGQLEGHAVKIARVRNPSYFSLLGNRSLPFAPVDHVIDAEYEAAQTIHRALSHGASGEVIEVGNRRLNLQPMVVAEGHPFAGRSVAAVRRSSKAEFLVPLVLRDGEATIPKGDTRVQAGDTVYFLGSEEALTEVFEAGGERLQPIRRIAIFGGGSIAEHLLDRIFERDNGHGPIARLLRRIRPGAGTVTVFDHDIDRCKELAAKYRDIRVHHIDVSDEDAPLQEQLPHYDLAIALTGSQELNLVTAAQAKLLGVKRCIALVITNNYLRVARRMQIDVTVSLKDTVARRIVALTRKSGVSSVYAISEAELEILEGTVSRGSQLDGCSLRDADLPRDSLVLYVIREGRTLMPEGNLTLAPDDQVGVLTRTRSIPRIEGRFRATP